MRDNAKSLDQLLAAAILLLPFMQHLPLLQFPADILFLIFYQLSVEDLVNLASVSFIPIHQVAPMMMRFPTDLQDLPLHFQ